MTCLCSHSCHFKAAGWRHVRRWRGTGIYAGASTLGAAPAFRVLASACPSSTSAESSAAYASSRPAIWWSPNFQGVHLYELNDPPKFKEHQQEALKYLDMAGRARRRVLHRRVPATRDDGVGRGGQAHSGADHRISSRDPGPESSTRHRAGVTDTAGRHVHQPGGGRGRNRAAGRRPVIRLPVRHLSPVVAERHRRPGAPFR